MSWLVLLLGASSFAPWHVSPEALAAPCRAACAYSLDEILDAIRTVETGGESDGGRHATGDGGLAIGPFQIHRAHWLDTRLAGKYEDCRDPAYARREVVAYWRRYCPDALVELDAQVLARVHNGGPRSSGKESARAYWEKTRVQLEKARSESHRHARVCVA